MAQGKGEYVLLYHPWGNVQCDTEVPHFGPFHADQACNANHKKCPLQHRLEQKLCSTTLSTKLQILRPLSSSHKRMLESPVWWWGFNKQRTMLPRASSEGSGTTGKVSVSKHTVHGSGATAYINNSGKISLTVTTTCLHTLQIEKVLTCHMKSHRCDERYILVKSLFLLF